MRKRIHIFVDRDSVKPITYEKPRISVCDYEGNQILVTKKVHLIGNWTLRQYNNPVPCGATVVLYPADHEAAWYTDEMLKEESDAAKRESTDHQ